MYVCIEMSFRGGNNIPKKTATFLTTVAEKRVLLTSVSTVKPEVVITRNMTRNGAPDAIPFCPANHTAKRR